MRELLIACGVIGAVAVAVPHYLSMPRERSDGAPARGGRAEVAAARAVSAGGEVSFRAARNGHFYLDAEVNGSPVGVMVDTGATIVALRESDAEAAGVRVTRADFTQPISTANGAVLAAPVELDRVSVGGIEIEGVEAVVLPDEQLGVNLLGGSFLNRLRRFEVAGDTLLIEG